MADIIMENTEELIRQNMPFIIKTVSGITGRYVSVENDDELSIALDAFSYSVETFDPERGSFLSYARLVMESRIKNYFAKEEKHRQTESLDVIMESGMDIPDGRGNPDGDMEMEIREYKSELKKFDITLDTLADNSPKHKDTRQKAIEIAKAASCDRETVNNLKTRFKIPVRHVSELAGVSEKTVKRSKIFIIAAVVLMTGDYPLLSQFVKNKR